MSQADHAALHRDWMRAAIDTAIEGARLGEVPIGSVLVDPTRQAVLARGWNQGRSTGDRTRHAEMVALANAGRPGQPIADGLTLVTTLEPCAMCLGAALELNVAHVIYGLEAPANGGVARLSDPKRMPRLTAGVLRDDCRRLLRDWLGQQNPSGGSGFIQELLDATDD
ncbi:MAG: nucleoside deaminase [Planctomycetota bacterium]